MLPKSWARGTCSLLPSLILKSRSVLDIWKEGRMLARSESWFISMQIGFEKIEKKIKITEAGTGYIRW